MDFILGHMTRTFMLASLLIFSIHHLHCEEIGKAPAFEVASITPCKPDAPEPPMEHAGLAQFTYPGGRFSANCTTLKFLLEWAYGIQPAQHSDGPGWVGTDRYDIVAKAEGNPSDAQMKLMMQMLLGERFRLRLRRESREVTAYVIAVGKTPPHLVRAKEEETHSVRVDPQTGADQRVVYRVIITRFSLAELGDLFGRQLGRVVVDRTGLDGDFDFNLDLAPDESHASPVDPSLLIVALREQVGLTVKSEKTPVDFLVIEGVEKVVAGN
jgi:uncharacterized protein (TIGR03435 family)